MYKSIQTMYKSWECGKQKKKNDETRLRKIQLENDFSFYSLCQARWYLNNAVEQFGPVLYIF